MARQLGEGPARDGQELQHRHGPGHLLVAQHLDGAVGGPGRAQHGGQRHEELAHVASHPAVVGGRLGQVEVDQPRLVGLVDQHVVAAQVAVGDAQPVQQLHLLPDLEQQLVVEVAGVEVVEAASAHALLDEEHLTVGGPRRQQDVGHPYPTPRREQGEQGLVLDLALAGDERHLVLEAVEGDEAPEPDQHIGAALLAAQDLHEQLLAVRPPPDEADVAAPADPGRLQRGYVEAGATERLAHLLHRRVPRGSTPRQVEGGADRPPDSRARDHVEGQIEPAVETGGGHREDQAPRRPPGRPAHVRTGGGRQGGGDGDGSRRESVAQGHPVGHHQLGHVVELGHVSGGGGPADDLLEEAGQAVTEGGGRNQLAHQSGPARQKGSQRRHLDGDGRTDDEQSEGQRGEDPGEIVEEAEGVGLRRAHVAVPGEPGTDHHQEEGDDEADDVPGVASARTGHAGLGEHGRHQGRG